MAQPISSEILKRNFDPRLRREWRRLFQKSLIPPIAWHHHQTNLGNKSCTSLSTASKNFIKTCKIFFSFLVELLRSKLALEVAVNRPFPEARKLGKHCRRTFLPQKRTYELCQWLLRVTICWKTMEKCTKSQSKAAIMLGKIYKMLP